MSKKKMWILVGIVVCGLGISMPVMADTVSRRDKIKSSGSLNYGNGAVRIESSDLIYLADEIDNLENTYKQTSIDALNDIGTFFKSDGTIVNDRGKNEVDTEEKKSRLSFEKIIKGIKESQSVDSLLRTQAKNKNGEPLFYKSKEAQNEKNLRLVTTTDTGFPVYYQPVLADNLSAGTAAWVDGSLIKGNGADNAAYYDLGIAFADSRVNKEAASYSNGYDTGYEEGEDAGYTAGYEEGKDTGYTAGYEEGEKTGHSNGYNSGYEEGEKTGYSNGYNSGYGEGEAKGYNHGYTIGYKEGENTGYTTGYSKGEEKGYTAGYEEGEKTGHSNGYNSGYEEGEKTGYSNGYNSGYEKGCAEGKLNISVIDKATYDFGNTYQEENSVSYTALQDCYIFVFTSAHGNLVNTKISSGGETVSEVMAQNNNGEEYAAWHQTRAGIYKLLQGQTIMLYGTGTYSAGSTIGYIVLKM